MLLYLRWDGIRDLGKDLTEGKWEEWVKEWENNKWSTIAWIGGLLGLILGLTYFEFWNRGRGRFWIAFFFFNVFCSSFGIAEVSVSTIDDDISFIQ